MTERFIPRGEPQPIEELEPLGAREKGLLRRIELVLEKYAGKDNPIIKKVALEIWRLTRRP